jgi:hypothetical protein
VPYFIKVESIQEVEDLLSLNQDPTQNEGLVIVDSNFNRIKVRNPNFDRLSYNMNPKDESDALKQLFFSILLAISPSSSTTPTITTYCFYDLNGNGSCSDISSPPPGSSGPYDACGTGIFDCVLVTYCWYDILPPYTRPSLCIPSGYSPPANYAGGTAICGIDACVNPLYGPMSVQSSNEFTISNVCGSSFNPKAIKLNNQITSDFVAMCNWIISEYKKYKLGDEQSKIKIIEIWQKAFVSLENNQPITSLISIDLIDECKDAINRYNCLLNINVN